MMMMILTGEMLVQCRYSDPFTIGNWKCVFTGRGAETDQIREV